MARFALLSLFLVGLIAPSEAFVAVPTRIRLPSPQGRTTLVVPHRPSHVDYRLSNVASFDPKVVTDLAVAGTLGFGTLPLAQALHNATTGFQDDDDQVSKFRSTLWHGVADSIAWAARVFGLVCLVDLVFENKQIMSYLPAFLVDKNLRAAAPQLGVLAWATLTIRTIKRTLFARSVSKHPDRLGRMSLYDRGMDFFIFALAAFFASDILQIDFGSGIKSLFAAGGVGAVGLGLGAKDFSTQIVGGLVIAVKDNFEEGERVRLADGTEGTVRKIGLTETQIQGPDNAILKIPNSQLIDKKVANLSRVERSRVQQTLRFKYADLKKIPAVLQDIKDEIRAACPKLITDGSRPFRANMMDFMDNHIKVEVDSHFLIKPLTEECMENREKVLFAIARAMEKNGVEFSGK